MSRRDPPEVRQQRGSPTPRPGRCGQKLALTDPPRYCLQWSRRGGSGRCGRFGHCDGIHLRGQDNPRFKDGRTSRYAYLSPKIYDAFQAALADERLTDLTDDIALLEVAKHEAAKAWQAGAAVEALRQVKHAFTELERAARAGQQRPFKAALAKCHDLLWKGWHAEAREELTRTIERKGRLVRTRQQILADNEDLIPAKRVTLVMALVAGLIREFIENDQRRVEFSRRFAGLLGPRLSAPGGAEPQPEAGSDGATDDAPSTAPDGPAAR